MRKIHNDPEVADAIRKLEAAGWRVKEQGHRYYLLCPCGDRRGRIRVDNSPRNPALHAKRILRESGHCPDSHDLD